MAEFEPEQGRRLTEGLSMPFGPATRELVATGDEKAMLKALVCTAAHWFELSGYHIGLRADLTRAACTDRSNVAAPLLAAALDLCALLELSPQGGEALADFGRQPLFEKAKGE